MQAEPGQLAVEPLAVGRVGEVAVGRAPIGDRPANAMDELPDPSFAFISTHLAVEVLVGHDVGGQLAPGGRDFTVVLLEQHLSAFPLDGRRPQAPFHRGEGVGVVVGAKHRRDFHVLAVLLSGSRMGPLGRHDRFLGVAFQLVHSYVP